MLRIFVKCNGHILLLDAKNDTKAEIKGAVERVIYRMTDEFVAEEHSRMICEAFCTAIGCDVALINSSSPVASQPTVSSVYNFDNTLRAPHIPQQAQGASTPYRRSSFSPVVLGLIVAVLLVGGYLIINHSKKQSSGEQPLTASYATQERATTEATPIVSSVSETDANPGIVSETVPPIEQTEPAIVQTEPAIVETTTPPVINLTLQTEDITFWSPGENFTLNAAGVPSGYSIAWYSENESIASIDQNGRVTAKGYGTTRVIASVGSQTASCWVRCSFDYVDRYIEVLEESKNWGSRCRFALAFLDDDMIPELLIMPDNFHFAPVTVYTAPYNQAVNLGEFGTFGQMEYGYKSGMLLSGDYAYGGRYVSLFQMNRESVNAIDVFYHGPDEYFSENAIMEYIINNEQLSREEYQSFIEWTFNAVTIYSIGYSSGWDISDSTIALFKENPDSFVITGDQVDYSIFFSEYVP